MPVYTSESHDTWEKELLKEVERSVKEVWTTAGKPDRVLLAVDGVVPMAKIRQQRVRRFKSVWIRKVVASASPTGGESWDTNAITPGTEFMDSLGLVLNNLARKHKWTVSGVDEVGEGEHKIMKWLRDGEFDGDILVYGLDADLILLSMLVGEQKGLSLYLLREKQEFGRMTAPAPGAAQEYQFMNIREFQGRLGLAGYANVLNYIGYMSLMGNDFLPHSLTHKLSDDGHEFVINEIRRQNTPLLEDGQVSLTVLKDVLGRWSLGEEDRMLGMIRKKREQAVRGVGKGSSGAGEEEGLPLKWDAEAALMDGARLKQGWKEGYWRILSANYDVDHVCGEYVKGFQWIIDYYTGKPVNLAWMFPAWIPPLWSDLAAFLEVERSVEISAVPSGGVSPKPQEQLAMVLPLESWGLVRDSGLRRLPALMPQMWPRKFGFVSLGRKWLWECEAKIPVLMVERLLDASKDG